MTQKFFNPMMLSPTILLAYPEMFMTPCAGIWYHF